MMSSSERNRMCFVVMPFGEKKDLDGQEIDFDDIYRFFFKKAIEDLGVDCIRCDEIEEAGSIHEKMFEHIYQDDIVVVDITTSNANVYYELGVRHALAKGVTVLIRRKGTTIPFNIQGLQVIEYDQANFGSIERAKDRIHHIIKNGLDKKIIDSPVHKVLDLNIEPEGKPLSETKVFEFHLATKPDVIIGLITGDLQHVFSGIDVWVNSENIYMQMARPFENSISGVIRYLGQEREQGKIKDTIVLALADKMNGRETVDSGEIVVTQSGALLQSHKVKLIFHAASVVGQVGQGYTPIPDVRDCVVNALRAPTAKAHKEECRDHELKSILFPLIGTRPRRGNVDEQRVKPLLDAAIDYLSNNDDCPFKEVYFLTYTDKELQVCQDLLQADSRLLTLNANPPAGGTPVVPSQVSQSSASTSSASPILKAMTHHEDRKTDVPTSSPAHSAGAARSNSRTPRKRARSR